MGPAFDRGGRGHDRLRLATAHLEHALVGCAHGDDQLRRHRQGSKATRDSACDTKIGSLSVVEPEQKWWLQYNLESPEALIKVFVAQSAAAGASSYANTEIGQVVAMA